MITSFSIKHEPTTVKNPQANSILERVHQVVMNMISTPEFDMQDTCEPEMTDEILSNVVWAILLLCQAKLFLGEIFYSISITYIADWADIGKRSQ